MRGSKIKVMHVAECAGGVDRYLHSLIKYLNHEKIENILVCSQNYIPEDFSSIADCVEQIHMDHEIGISDILGVLRVRKLIKMYNPDIVYAHSSKAGALVRVADIGIRSKCIYNPHGWAFNMQGSAKNQMVYKWIEKIMAPFCSKIICISDTEKKSAIQNHICFEKKIQVILNGIDIEEYETRNKVVTRESLKIPEDAFVVGVVGRLTKQKAPDVFIKMDEKIKEQVSNAHFLMVGNGELEDMIIEYAEKHGIINCLHITGWINNPLDYIEMFDVACLLSRWEGFGLAIPEYMMCRKPIVATAVDAIPNLIRDNDNGLLVPMDDYNAAAETVMKLYRDTELKTKLVQHGLIDVYEKYDVKRVAKEHETLFLKMVKWGKK